MSDKFSPIKMISNKSRKISCICNREINSYLDYKLVFLTEVSNEIDIFCPNSSCSIKELGYIKFNVNEDETLSFSKAKFYPTFVSFNVQSINDENYFLLKSHLKELVSKRINWPLLAQNIKMKFYKPQE